MKKKMLLSIIILLSLQAFAHEDCPYPVKKISLQIENRNISMAYMDIKPANETVKNIVLLHGKNFNGYYWKDVIPFLVEKGYRVIVPDQVGWGKSDHPNIDYSFSLLANNTKVLLDSLHIIQTVVLGHSMGGMLATRFVLMYPEIAQRLILENPIGLEDYKTFVPWQPLSKLWAKEKAATYDSYKKYQQSYYPAWKPEYEQYVQAQAADLKSPNFDSISLVNALTYQMILEQPVVYEFSRLKLPVLLIIGQADRTIVGKDQLDKTTREQHGLYPQLGESTAAAIKNSQLIKLVAVGHIPHVQEPEKFKQALNAFLP